MRVDRFRGNIGALAGYRAQLADVAGRQVQAPLPGHKTSRHTQLVLRDVGQLIAGRNVSPGIEFTGKRAAEFGFGRPRVVEAQRHIDAADGPVVTRTELESADRDFAAVKLISDVCATPG